MVKIRVIDGTPEGTEFLCRTCTRAHIIKGFCATEEEVFCRYFYLERQIRFPVRECSFYEDKRLSSLGAMEEIAWILKSTTTKPLQNVGFVGRTQNEECQEEEQLPAAEHKSKRE
jgi:hypothetical protein